MENRFIYNNEAIGVVAISSVLSYMKCCSYSKSLLIIPFFAHKQTTSFLKNTRAKVRSLEELILKKGEYFLNFNERYFSLLPVSFNSLMILQQLEAVKFTGRSIVYNPDFDFDYQSNKLGRRAADIIKGSERLAQLLAVEAEKLYLQLRIQL